MRILQISAKCSDLFSATVSDENKESQLYDGYVPSWFPNPKAEHYGDYVDLKIDLDTGKILNWKTPTRKQLTETFGVSP